MIRLKYQTFQLLYVGGYIALERSKTVVA